MFKHLLIPTDGSPVSRQASKAGIELARALGARITAYYAVVHMRPLLSADLAYAPSVSVEIESDDRKAGRMRVESIRRTAEKCGVTCHAAVTDAYTAREGIIEIARRELCDAIFMGSHGRRGLARLFIGSVTRDVLEHSPIPVIVYRKPVARRRATQAHRPA